MYKLCYLLIHLFNLCDPLCKVLHLACSPTFTFRAVSTSIVQIKNNERGFDNNQPEVKIRVKNQGAEERKVDDFLIDISKAGAPADTRFSIASFPDTHTHTYSPGPGNCLSVTAGRIHRSILRKCICKDTEVLFRSKPLILKRPPPSFLPLRYWHQCN